MMCVCERVFREMGELSEWILPSTQTFPAGVIKRICCQKGGGEEAILGLNGFCRLWTLQHTDFSNPLLSIRILYPTKYLLCPACIVVLYTSSAHYESVESYLNHLHLWIQVEELFISGFMSVARWLSWDKLGQAGVSRTKAVGFIGEPVRDQRDVCTSLSPFPVL